MIRLLALLAISLIANAIGLIVAAAVLDDMSLSAAGFILDVAIFTGVALIAQPVVQKLALTRSDALLGSSALIASLIALIVTAWISDDLHISGIVTWALAVVIIWAVSLLASFLLPAVMFKRALERRR